MEFKQLNRRYVAVFEFVPGILLIDPMYFICREDIITYGPITEFCPARGYLSPVDKGCLGNIGYPIVLLSSSCCYFLGICSRAIRYECTVRVFNKSVRFPGVVWVRDVKFTR